MANLQGVERSLYVREMFGRIAARYDLMNRIMTAGQDVRWRKQVIDLAALPQGGWLLDLGAGTGDLTRLALEHSQEAPRGGCRFYVGNDASGKETAG